jgi:N-acyl-D-aspartate/D-glutamate deacylase
VGASDAGAHLDMITMFDFTTSLLRACRDRHLLSLEDTVRLFTDVPARLYGLRDRGRIAEGAHADLVVFDEARIAPRCARWRQDLPAGGGRLYAEADGISRVIVNGVEIVHDNETTGARPGRLLRSGRDTETVPAR